MSNKQKYSDELLFRSGPGYWRVSWVYIVAWIMALWMMFASMSDPAGGTVISCVGFFVMVLLFVATLHSRADWRNRELQRTIRESADQESGAQTRVCPRCAETIKAAALVCRFCGNELQPLESRATDSAVKSARRASPSPPPAAPSYSRPIEPLPLGDANTSFDAAIDEALGKKRTLK